MKIHFITSYGPSSKFKLHSTHKFCRMYKLQYTHCFFRVKTAFVQFKKREIHPQSSVNFKLQPATLLKSNTPPRALFTFFKASHILY